MVVYYLSYLHLAPQLGVTQFQFHQCFLLQKTIVAELLCGVGCVMKRFCFDIGLERRLVTNGHGVITYCGLA